MTKDVIACIEERRSIRQLGGEVDDATIARLLESAVLAPSAGNQQPWFFYVVKNLEIKEQLVEAALGQRFLMDAPVVIVVCVDPEVSAARYGDRGRELYCIQDAAAAAQNILLTATAYGLGTTWVGAFSEERVAAALNLPSNHRPLTLIPVGVPQGEPKARPRKNLDDLVQVIE
ncbi:MAG: nitroreductase family protein [Firmicutes bacterium]|nr:nitroreductase family protein [Bacillota bacterium]